MVICDIYITERLTQPVTSLSRRIEGKGWEGCYQTVEALCRIYRLAFDITVYENSYAMYKKTSIISVRRDCWVHDTSLSSSLLSYQA